MSAEVDLANIISFNYSHVTRVRGVMGSAMVYAAPSRESNASLDLIRLDKPSVGVLDLIANVDKLHARLDYGLGVFPDLSVALCRLPKCFIVVSEQSLLLAILSGRSPLPVVI